MGSQSRDADGNRWLLQIDAVSTRSGAGAGSRLRGSRALVAQLSLSGTQHPARGVVLAIAFPLRSLLLGESVVGPPDPMVT